jgi:hypothetical protein
MTIHPAKTPMEGGFSLEKFTPNTDPEIAQVLDDVLDALEKERKLKGWIPCADRLPEKDQKVLIYLDENEGGMLELGYTSLITIAIYTGEGDEGFLDWEADANAPIEDGCQPTHWMPLPEPPTV